MKLITTALILFVSSRVYAAKAIMEGIQATNNAIYVATTAPSGYVQVGGSGTVKGAFSAGGTDLVTDAVNHRVGVGTASPCSTCTLHVAGNVSMTGIVSANNQPFVRAYVSSSQSVVNGGVSQTIYFGGELSDAQSMHDVSASSGTFTIPTNGAGIYLINAHLDFAANATGTYRSIGIKVNGGLKAYTSNPSVGAQALSVCDVIFLSAGDAVTVYLEHDATSAITTNSGNPYNGVAITKLW